MSASQNPRTTPIASRVFRTQLAFRPPYRLDFTAFALRRVEHNPVDVTTSDGRYLRAFSGGDRATIVEVSQPAPDHLDVRITGRDGHAYLPTVATMLGVDVDLREWYQRVKTIPWLARLAHELQGLRPPRYPDLWEAVCHGIVFQQLSIVAAAAIMQRFVHRFSEPVSASGALLYPFPSAEIVERADESTLVSVGLSRMKARYLKDAARSVLSGIVDPKAVEALPSPEALSALRSMRGIGQWSAAVILLRGFGRLDVFPPNDSGVARSMKLLSSNPVIDTDSVLETLDGVRGMLYFHLLLGRRYALAPEATRADRASGC